MNKKSNLDEVNNVVDFAQAKKKHVAKRPKQSRLVQWLVTNARFAKSWPWLVLALVFGILLGYELGYF